PALREKVYAAVRARAVALFEDLHKSFVHMRTANAGCDSGLISAYLLTLGAGKQCQLLGGSCEFPSGDDLAWRQACQAGTARSDK
ncbi:MAG TPA: hypothetical protein VIV58_11690, partial [Kofleriaceae bacterium]